MSIAEHQPPTATVSHPTTIDPDLAKFAAGSVVQIIGDSEQRSFTVITRYYTWSDVDNKREYHYRLFREIGNGRHEMTWKRESEIEGVGTP